MGIKKDIRRVFSANLISMATGFIISFIVPAVLSIDSFAYVKTYTLYFSYVGFLHLGFIDGMHIKYGGKSEDEIDKSMLKLEHKVFIIMQIIFTILVILISILCKDTIIFLIGISILPANMLTFYKLFYQSTGEFKKYTNNTYMYNILYISFNIIVIFLLKSEHYFVYCVIQILATAICAIKFELDFNKRYKNIKSAKYDKLVWENVKIGWTLLVANLILTVFNSIDLWFVKIFFEAKEFSYYSFAISLLSFIQILITTVSITFYSYLAKNKDEEMAKSLKVVLICIGTFSSLAYFAINIFINIFLQKYSPALNIISITFATLPYMIVIKALYINMYKADKRINDYLKVTVIMSILAIILNFIMIVLFKRFELVAIATLIVFILWYFYSGYDTKILKSNKKEVIYLFLMSGAFLFSSNYLSLISGLIFYLIAYLILTYVLYGNDLKKLLLKDKIKN